MAVSYRARFLGVMRANERRMAALFGELSAGIAADVTRRAGPDGTVSRTATLEIQRSAGERVNAFFLATNRRGERAAFELLPDGTLLPLSPYLRALWRAITEATRLPVEQHAGLISRRLPPDLMARLRSAQRNPFAAARTAISEQVFRPNPLARYAAPHQWVDPNGYTLSDRIWNTAGDTRRRLDAYLDEAIRQGRGALAMDREIEQFLVPGRSLTRTKAPYGTDASYDAMRLARTEISRAHAQASEMSAALNPFVEGLKWNLSGSHPRPDICDDNARGGPYPLDSPPTLPAHPHCLCYWTYAMVPADRQRTILDELRADVRRERSLLMDLIGPLLVEQFIQLLLGSGLQERRELGGAGLLRPEPLGVLA